MPGAAWAWKAECPGLKRHHFFPFLSLAFPARAAVTLQLAFAGTAGLTPPSPPPSRGHTGPAWLLHMCPPSYTPPQPTRLSQSMGWAPCAHAAAALWLSILRTVVYMFQCCSLSSSHPLLPSLCPQVCSLCLHLYSCPANKFISTTFLDSIYMHENIWFSLSDLLHSI